MGQFDFPAIVCYNKGLNNNKKRNYKKEMDSVAAERHHLKRVARNAEVNAAYDDDKTGPDKGWDGVSKEELANEWEQLRRHAKTHFPEGSEFTDLTAPQKLVAIASVLGWSPTKIAKASGIHVRTIHRYLSPKERPDVVYFADQYRIKTGEKDVMDLQKENLYTFLRFASDILRDDDRGDVSKQRLKFDVGKWTFESIHGKPGQKIEHEGLDIKVIYDQLAQLGSKPIDEEEEKELFTIN